MIIDNPFVDQRLFLYRLVDKLPDWIESFKKEGKTDAEIDQLLQDKKAKYVDKWGNKSRVGILMSDHNAGLLRQ
jgi:hypothetical protein